MDLCTYMWVEMDRLVGSYSELLHSKILFYGKNQCFAKICEGENIPLYGKWMCAYVSHAKSITVNITISLKILSDSI